MDSGEVAAIVLARAENLMVERELPIVGGSCERDRSGKPGPQGGLGTDSAVTRAFGAAFAHKRSDRKKFLLSCFLAAGADEPVVDLGGAFAGGVHNEHVVDLAELIAFQHVAGDGERAIDGHD